MTRHRYQVTFTEEQEAMLRKRMKEANETSVQRFLLKLVDNEFEPQSRGNPTLDEVRYQFPAGNEFGKSPKKRKVKLGPIRRDQPKDTRGP